MAVRGTVAVLYMVSAGAGRPRSRAVNTPHHSAPWGIFPLLRLRAAVRMRAGGGDSGEEVAVLQAILAAVCAGQPDTATVLLEKRIAHVKEQSQQHLQRSVSSKQHPSSNCSQSINPGEGDGDSKLDRTPAVEGNLCHRHQLTRGVGGSILSGLSAAAVSAAETQHAQLRLKRLALRAAATTSAAAAARLKPQVTHIRVEESS